MYTILLQRCLYQLLCILLLVPLIFLSNPIMWLLLAIKVRIPNLWLRLVEFYPFKHLFYLFKQLVH